MMEKKKSLNEKQKANFMQDNISDITGIEIEMDSSNYNPAPSTSSKPLIDIANNTFQELCKTLESEQQKLLELEDRRKKLQEDMLRLKKEIEEEKNAYSLELAEYDVNIPDALKGKDNTSQMGNSLDNDDVSGKRKVPQSETADNGDASEDLVKRNCLANELKEIMKTIADDQDDN